MADAAQLKTRIEKVKNQLKGKTIVVTKARRTKKTLKRLQRRLKLVLIQGKKLDEQKAKHEEHLKKKTEKEEKRTLREAAKKAEEAQSAKKTETKEEKPKKAPKPSKEAKS